MPAEDAHRGQPVLHIGPPLAGARAAAILIHGRGATAESILGLGDDLDQPDVAFLAPQAAGRAWYPHRFLEPLASNEPWLSSALAVVARLLAEAGSAGLPPERVALIGFSQGACLALEFAARNPRRYGAVVALSGGLIGPSAREWHHTGSLDDTPFFLGCSDVDAHIPLSRVQESSEAMAALGGAVTQRIYPGMGHTVNDNELLFAQGLLAALGATAPRSS